MRRVFIAIKIIPGYKLSEDFRAVKRMLKNYSVKWIEPENLHLTLAFLGNMSGEKIIRISQLIERVVADQAAIRFVLKGVGVFRSSKDVRVLWMGIEGADGLKSIQSILSEELIKAGYYDGGNKMYRPHLTLGRPRSKINPDRIDYLVDTFRDRTIEEQYITEILFYESNLSGPSPVYRVISRHSLNTTAP